MKNTKKIATLISLVIVAMVMSTIFFVDVAYADQENVYRIRSSLKRALHDYFKNPDTPAMSLPKIKDLLNFYLSIPQENETADTSGTGIDSNTIYETIIAEAEAIQTEIPRCNDGTEYGYCSATKPKYCYAGRLIDKCEWCDCPIGSACLNNTCIAGATTTTTTSPPITSTSSTSSTTLPVQSCCCYSSCEIVENCAYMETCDGEYLECDEYYCGEKTFYANDSFDENLDGWSFWSRYSCGGYSLSWTSNTNDGGGAHVSGDSFACYSGMKKTFDISDWADGPLYLKYDYRATSSKVGGGVTNTRLCIPNATYGDDCSGAWAGVWEGCSFTLGCDDLVCNVEDTGWQSTLLYDISDYVSGRSEITVCTHLFDNNEFDFAQENFFDNFRLFSYQLPPDVTTSSTTTTTPLSCPDYANDGISNCWAECVDDNIGPNCFTRIIHPEFYCSAGICCESIPKSCNQTTTTTLPASTFMDDTFDSDLEGWTFWERNGCTGYSLSWTPSGYTGGGLVVKGDDFDCEAGMKKTVGLSGWDNDPLYLDFNIRAKSNSINPSITNFKLCIPEESYGSDCYTAWPDNCAYRNDAVTGSTLDTGWMYLGPLDISSVVAGRSEFTICTVMRDAWSQNWVQMNYFDNFRVVSSTSPPTTSTTTPTTTTTSTIPPSTTTLPSGPIFELANTFDMGVDFQGIYDYEFMDMDGDGDMDILAAVRYPCNEPTPSKVFINNNCTFAEATQDFGDFPSGDLIEDFEIGDVDNDGDLDIVENTRKDGGTGCLTWEGHIRVYKNDGNNVFTRGPNFNTGTYTDDIELGDLDNDGDLDLISGDWYPSNYDQKIFFNDGNGNFVDSGQRIGDRYYWNPYNDIEIGDLDNDGDLDFVAATGDNAVALNDGTGTFHESQIFDYEAYTAVLGDVDGDGDLDYLASHGRLYFNDGSGVFTPSGQSVGSNNNALGDIDNDGDLDIAKTGYDSIWISYNNGNGYFADVEEFESKRSEIVLFDIDDDGDLDLFTGGFTGYNDDPNPDSKLFSNTLNTGACDTLPTTTTTTTTTLPYCSSYCRSPPFYEYVGTCGEAPVNGSCYTSNTTLCIYGVHSAGNGPWADCGSDTCWCHYAYYCDPNCTDRCSESGCAS